MTRPTLRVFAVVLGASLLAGAALAGPDSTLTLDPKGAMTILHGYLPVQVELSSTKPRQVKKEPAYLGTPQYGIIHLGNGPRRDYVVVLDEPANGDWKIYIDKNQDGDLTENGDGAWNKKTVRGDRAIYGPMDLTLRASYGSHRHETSSADYTIGLYRISGASLFIFRQSARVGEVEIDGKTHKAVLAENDCDALFDKKARSYKDAQKSRPVWLKVDLKDEEFVFAKG